MHSRIGLLGAVMLGLGASHSGAQAQASVTPVGVWRGTSRCTVRPSPCNDESAVYRISQMKTADSVAIDGRKIVRGEEEEMGILTCRYTAQNAQLTCAIGQGVFRFTVRGDSLVGDLRLNDNTRFREIRLKRTP